MERVGKEDRKRRSSRIYLKLKEERLSRKKKWSLLLNTITSFKE